MKFKKHIISTITLCIAFGALIWFLFNHNTCSNYSYIQKISSFDQVNFNLITQDTLVLFDVDDTLIIPSSVVMRNQIKEKHQHWLNSLVEDTFKSATKPVDEYFVHWMIKEVPLIIEQSIVSTIKSLQNRGVKVLALTNLSTGLFSKIKSLPEWRYKKLKILDIDFHRVHLPDIEFTQLPKNNGTYPVLYHGILATNHESKGRVLGAFLDYMHWKPSKIIFFDDAKKRIDEVAQACCERNIPFIGYQYLGAEYIIHELNPEVAKLQFKYLIDNEDWLSDEEASIILKKKE